MSGIAWSPEDEEVVRAANLEVLMSESKSEIKTLGERLGSLPVGLKERNRDRTGDAVLRTLRADRRPQLVTEAIGRTRHIALAPCEQLDRPVFSIQSPEAESSTIASQANANAGTLEVSARAGAINGSHFPSSEETPFIMAFNWATAWIGGSIAIPPHGSATHGPATILDVRVGLQIENIWSNGPVVPGSAGNLIWTSAGYGDLPLRGTAIASCRAGLTLHGANGTRSRRSIRFVSGWVNRDGMDQEDRAPGGSITLSHAVAISSELVVAGIFVDVTCFVAAEESQVDLLSESAYAELRCRRGDGYPVPSRIRLDPERTSLRICELPALVG